MNAFAIGLGSHPQECRLTPLVNHPSDIRDFAADDPAKHRSHAAEKAHRLNAVADDDPAWRETLEPHAVDLIAGQSRKFGFNTHCVSEREPPSIAAHSRRCE